MDRAEGAFRCTCDGQPSAFLGASVIAFRDAKIAGIREDRMDDGRRRSPSGMSPASEGESTARRDG